MLSNNREPTFNLKVVVRETGLKPDTLRAWERRYGLPQPQRTSGGHRLYSQRDIEILKWLVTRQHEGLSISRAVDLWHQLVSEGGNPLETLQSAPLSAGRPSRVVVGQALSEMRQAWVSACLAFDEQEAEQILTQAFALYPTETVCFELITTALAEIGRGWDQGDVTVHQEHFASGLAIRRLETLIAAAPNPTKAGRLITCCPAGEEHVFVSLLLTLVLRRRGRDVVYLGANVPVVRLETTIASTNPNLVVLSAQHLPSAATLREMGQVLAKLKVPMAYGGQIFNLMPDLRRRISGHFLGERLDASADLIEQLLTSPRPTPAAEKVSEPHQRALSAYLRNQARIEADVWQVIERIDTPVQELDLNMANQILGQNIAAALAFGDMAFVGNDLDGVRQLLSNHQSSIERLRIYLRAYRQAVETQLGPVGQSITSWFDDILANSL